MTSSLNPGPARAGISPERPPRVSLPAATISHRRQVPSLSDHRFSFAARPRIFSTDQQARSTTAATPSPNSVRAPPPELAAGPLRRAIRPLQALGEPHPGPPLLYALVLVAVAPWSHRTAYSGEFPAPRAASPSRAMPPALQRLPRHPSALPMPERCSPAKPRPKPSPRAPPWLSPVTRRRGAEALRRPSAAA